MKSFMLIFLICVFSVGSYADWKIDFSRRQQDMVELEKQKQIYEKEEKSVLDMVTDRQAPMQDPVIINTEKGFYPDRIQVKRDQRYRVHVVNVNQDKKNLSFMLDAFSEHHGTYFGEQIVFEIEPRKEGLFDFQCPETKAKGKFVVFTSDEAIESPLESVPIRRPASR